MISMLKFLDGPWEAVRGYLRDDLDHLESAINQRWATIFGDVNQLKVGAVGGDGTVSPRYVANTGTDKAPQWDQIDLAGTGVKNRLPFSRIPAATTPSILIGRRSGTAGDLEQITLGSGLSLAGTVLSAAGGDIFANKYESGVDETLLTGTSVYFPDVYEVGATSMLDLQGDAILEVG